ncbi:acyl carrier protein [Neptunicoccus cionae]|uniref:Carrier domain-containing protein n=1 Tax=Neptunicoccus cionae TaxID=2035344 RepID=A0A916QT15_9RHOB|nr:acyl carrier protein [Amylibacter cionae]GGA09754.1 hypothetical protein GCM10011498_07250 [Amylibacter cionae]
MPLDFADAGPRGVRRVSLPGYAFQRKRHWVTPEPVQTLAAPQSTAAQPTAPLSETVKSDPVMTMNANVSPVPRTERLRGELMALLSDLSGEDLGLDEVDVTYLELGFDSLFLGQVSQALLQKYDVTLTFRSLLTEFRQSPIWRANRLRPLARICEPCGKGANGAGLSHRPAIRDRRGRGGTVRSYGGARACYILQLRF